MLAPHVAQLTVFQYPLDLITFCFGSLSTLAYCLIMAASLLFDRMVLVKPPGYRDMEGRVLLSKTTRDCKEDCLSAYDPQTPDMRS